MRKLFLFASLLFSLFSGASAQTVVNIGSAGYVTFDGNDYERGYITYRWYLDATGDTLIELARQHNTSQPFRYGHVSTWYKDGDHGSTPFSTFAAFQTWYRANASAMPDTIVGVGGTTLLIDSAVCVGDNATITFTKTGLGTGRKLAGIWVSRGIDSYGTSYIQSCLAPQNAMIVSGTLSFDLVPFVQGIGTQPLQSLQTVTVTFTYY